MRIKELEDVLKLVDELPREYQLQCVKACTVNLDAWEARISEPQMSDAEWRELQWKRSCKLRRHALKKLNDTLVEMGIRKPPRKKRR